MLSHRGIFDTTTGGCKRVAKLLQESILIAFEFIWKVLLSDRNFATPLDPLLLAMPETFPNDMPFTDRRGVTKLLKKV